MKCTPEHWHHARWPFCRVETAGAAEAARQKCAQRPDLRQVQWPQRAGGWQGGWARSKRVTVIGDEGTGQKQQQGTGSEHAKAQVPNMQESKRILPFQKNGRTPHPPTQTRQASFLKGAEN